MTTFLTLLANSLRKPLLDKIKDYIEIQKGVLADKGFEKIYFTLVVGFLREQKGLDPAQAGKFFASPVTYDGVLAWLYNFTDPDREIRDKCQAALYLRTPGLQLVDPKAKQKAAETTAGNEAINIGDLPVVANFVGRTRELRQLRETVRNPQQPVISCGDWAALARPA